MGGPIGGAALDRPKRLCRWDGLERLVGGRMAVRPGPPRGRLALWGHFLTPQVTEAERGGGVSQGAALDLADGGG